MRNRYLAVLAVVAGTAVIALGACGSDDSGSSGGSEEADGAFIAGMVPHHESAIEMAEIAEEKADHPEIEELAANIISSQEAEIGELEAAHERIFDEPLSEAEHEPMEMSAEMMGEVDMAELENAKPFDLTFIDMMIPHHQGAIEMARAELADGQDAELMEIAQRIIDAQSAEIEDMNSWREEWYGSPSPAGGVPPEEEGSSDEMSSMEH
jgi:uncharacterized protein (DUF305 family)